MPYSVRVAPEFVRASFAGKAHSGFHPCAKISSSWRVGSILMWHNAREKLMIHETRFQLASRQPFALGRGWHWHNKG